jgi:hypothetical protein
MQEIVLPANVVILCGYKQISFSHFNFGLIFLALKTEELLRTLTAADLSDPV